MIVTVAALEVTVGDWICSHVDGVRTYTYRAVAEPRTVVDGKLTALPPIALQALTTAGWNGEISESREHADAEDGGSPAMDVIAKEQAEAIRSGLAALWAVWVNKTVQIEVRDA